MRPCANRSASQSASLVISADSFFVLRLDKLAALSLRQRVPTLDFYREFVAAGGLMSYSADLLDSYRIAGTYCGRILMGENPADCRSSSQPRSRCSSISSPLGHAPSSIRAPRGTQNVRAHPSFGPAVQPPSVRASLRICHTPIGLPGEPGCDCPGLDFCTAVRRFDAGSQGTSWCCRAGDPRRTALLRSRDRCGALASSAWTTFFQLRCDRGHLGPQGLAMVARRHFRGRHHSAQFS